MSSPSAVTLAMTLAVTRAVTLAVTRPVTLDLTLAVTLAVTRPFTLAGGVRQMLILSDRGGRGVLLMLKSLKKWLNIVILINYSGHIDNFCQILYFL